MRTIAAVLLLGLAAGVTPTLAEHPVESDKGRFYFKEVPEGILRFDSRTGQVSLCSRITEWACRTLADDRTALENEIGRLFDENAALRKQGERELTLPSDADLNKMMAFLEKMWRRLLDMAQRTQRELEQDRPGAHKNGT